MKIKKGDEVFVITGKDRGKRGAVEKVWPKKSRLIVRGVNLVKKHQKPRSSSQPGGIIEKPLPIDASNVMYWCKKCENRVRLGYELRGEKKLRVCRRCGAQA